MPRNRVLVLALASSLAFASARAHADAGALTGRVTAAQDKLGTARVYAYQVADTSLRRVTTDDDGRFRFESLPAGIYKIIAHKVGFLPVIVMLTRASAEAHQFLEMQLRSAPQGTAGAADFWSLREQVPADVLREIETASVVELTRIETPAVQRQDFRTEMQAFTGVDQRHDSGETMVTSGRLGLRGKVGEMRVGLSGDFWQLDGSALNSPMASDELTEGSASSLMLRLESDASGLFNVTSHNNRMAAVTSGRPIELENYRVSWSRPVGLSGQSTFVAQYINENNFYRWGYFNTRALPDASRTLRVEGTYATAWGERTNFETGVRYRQLETEYVRPGGTSSADIDGTLPNETIGVFGKGSYEASPAVVVEYGLYTSLSDGAVSLVPRGGLMLHLGPLWQAAGSFSHRVDAREVQDQVDFVPAYFSEAESMEHAEEYRYRLVLSRPFGDGGSFSLAALDRRFAESLRFYFSRKFIDRYENLFMVPGDRLPEMHLSVAKQLGKSVQARFDTYVSEGGGGVIVAGGGRQFENQVSYLVTSVDTQYTPTSTGVFLSFQRLSQTLTPVRASRAPKVMDLETLELMLSQDLGELLDLAAEWALQVSMEVSRGLLPDEQLQRDDLRRRLLGGVAVRF